jgi:uncharacterized protein
MAGETANADSLGAVDTQSADNDDIDYCHSCNGIWLDRGEIDKIVRAQNRIDEEHYRRYHRDRDYDDYDDDYYHYGGQRRRRGFLGDLFDIDQQ